MLSGKTTLIAHIGYPTEAFKAPLIYNPWFEKHGIDAMVVPMGVKPEDYPESLKAIFRMANVHGALVTMPHKVTTVGLVDELSTTAKIAGACNAILKRPDGSLLGDMFDGSGFVRGIQRHRLLRSAARQAHPQRPDRRKRRGGLQRRCGSPRPAGEGFRLCQTPFPRRHIPQARSASG